MVLNQPDVDDADEHRYILLITNNICVHLRRPRHLRPVNILPMRILEDITQGSGIHQFLLRDGVTL